MKSSQFWMAFCIWNYLKKYFHACILSQISACKSSSLYFNLIALLIEASYVINYISHVNECKVTDRFDQGVLRDCLQSQIGAVVKHGSLCYQLVLHSTNFGTFQKISILRFLSKWRKSKKWTFSKINNVNSSSIFA